MKILLEPLEITPFQSFYLPKNEAARKVLYLTQREYLSQADVYVLEKLGHHIELIQNKEKETPHVYYRSDQDRRRRCRSPRS